MALMNIFQRDETASATPNAAPDVVVVARTRARRRLIGATVLLAVGVIGFPMLFETQPRPIPVDIAIQIPNKESVPALSLPSPRTGAAANPPAEPAPDAPAVATTRLPTPLPTSLPTLPPTLPAPAATAEPAPAKALGAPPAAASDAGVRVVVQIGAFADADKLREVRGKVERLGLKTYTQVIDSDGARRTRVRVGPFATRAEAEQAVARIKAGGLTSVILIL